MKTYYDFAENEYLAFFASIEDVDICRKALEACRLSIKRYIESTKETTNETTISRQSNLGKMYNFL